MISKVMKLMLQEMNRFFFSTIDVSRQVFFRTPLTYAIVNLKPIVPGRKYDENVLF